MRARRAFHVVVYTDAEAKGGAERALQFLLGELDRSYRVTLAGPDAKVLAWIASARPGTDGCSGSADALEV